MFDRPLALLSIPGVPIYPAEVVLIIGVGYLLTRPEPFRGVPTGRWFAPALLFMFLGWGLIKLLTSLHYAVLDVFRDSALVYYALFALVVIGLSQHDSRFAPSELVRLYGRFVPYFMIVAPIRLIGLTIYGEDGPLIPGTTTSLTSHRSGNLGCAVGLAVVYLATSGRKDRATIAGVVAGFIMLLVIGTQNRGGMIAGGVAIGVAVLLWTRYVKLRLHWVALVLVSLAVLAWSLDVRIQTGNREISVSQFSSNVESVFGGGGPQDSQLNGTVSFRTNLWNLVLDRTVLTGQLENGWGFGPNLGSDFIPTHIDKKLRNPHNSHLTVLARLGIVGLAIWLLMWISWLYVVMRRALLARVRRRPLTDFSGRLALLVGCGVASILVNAYVDPTLETPMVAVWLWSLFGFGVIAVSAERMDAIRR